MGSVKAAEPTVIVKDKAYAGLLVSQSEKDPIIIKAGETKKIILKFKNLGTATWDSAKSNYISAYTMEPRNRDSKFKTTGWLSAWQTGKILGKVKPGATGELVVNLKAPLKTGDYLEKFYLASENYSWVQGGYFYLKIKVVENTTDAIATDNTDSNTVSTTVSATTSVLIFDSISSTTVSSTVAVASSTEQIVASSTVIFTRELIEEPRVRVGIWKPADFIQFRSDSDEYNVFDGENLVGVLAKGRMAGLNYDFVTKKYSLRGGNLNFETDNYIRLAPVNDPRAIFSLLNFEHQVKWRGGSRNFNLYRGAMEYRLNNSGKTMYVINDLSFEDYLVGIAEVTDSMPIEFIKAQAVAARTYAYYTQQSTTKHDERNFDVSGTTGDQLYLGYINEILGPNLVEAVSSTRGQMITYKNEVVITPYFGHSNGKTKAFNTVWGGPVKPWLVSVKTKYDKGLRQYGHGVGMSQRDAALRADKEKIDYVSLLKVYYTGVEVERIY